MRQGVRIAWIAAAGLLVGVAGLRPLWGQPPAASTANPLVLLGIGGRQVWADELFFYQWRIQRNSLQGDCRLLDGSDVCHARGSFEACQATLERIRRQHHLPAMWGEAVLVLHGLFRTRAATHALADYLQRNGGYLVLNVEYPSTQADVAVHARSLASIVDHLEGIRTIHLVGHSLGNILIRRWLADRAGQDAPRRVGPRLGRIVMLGPPNHGAQLATLLADEPLFQKLAGKTGQQLGPEWPWLASTLATPPCEFGIIAGGLQDGRGFNPWLPGDDDGSVTVESTRLEGAKDFLVLPVLHSPMLEDRRVLQQTLRFLKTGEFEKSSD